MEFDGGVTFYYMLELPPPQSCCGMSAVSDPQWPSSSGGGLCPLSLKVGTFPQELRDPGASRSPHHPAFGSPVGSSEPTLTPTLPRQLLTILSVCPY